MWICIDHILIERHWVRFLTQIISLSPQENPGWRYLLTMVLQTRKWRTQEMKQIAHCNEELVRGLSPTVNIQSGAHSTTWLERAQQDSCDQALWWHCHWRKGKRSHLFPPLNSRWGWRGRADVRWGKPSSLLPSSPFLWWTEDDFCETHSPCSVSSLDPMAIKRNQSMWVPREGYCARRIHFQISSPCDSSMSDVFPHGPEEVLLLPSCVLSATNLIYINCSHHVAYTAWNGKVAQIPHSCLLQ